MIILVVEDNPEQLALIKAVLDGEHYVIDETADGAEALQKIEVRDYDLAIIDLDLPKISGQQLIKRIRELGLATPVLVLTANDELGTKVNLLDSGADDYLTKPFAVDELTARVRALLRRPAPIVGNSLKFGDLEMIYETHEVSFDGNPIKLTKNEFRLLDYLIRKSGSVCTRAMIEEHVWGYDRERRSNLIEAVVYKLRKKLGSHGDRIETVQNLGYRYTTKNVATPTYESGQQAQQVSFG